MITQELVKNLFEYRDGELFWKITKGGQKIGNKAGSFSKCGYFYIQINNKQFRIHRIIYLMFYGKMPEFVDHKDGNKLNNKIENLRPATRSQNGFNRFLQKNNLSGYKNVIWIKNRNRWRVEFRINKKLHTSSLFKNINDAILEAEKMRQQYHNQFARSN